MLEKPWKRYNYGYRKFMNHLRNINEKNLQDLLSFAISSSTEGDQFGLSE